MVSVQQLYELWAGDSRLDEELARSLEPRGTDWLFERFAALGPQPGQLLLDVGARDARHAIRLVAEHGLRAVALDPVARHVELAQEAVAASGLEVEVTAGSIEELPLADSSVDWIWCRDVLVHVDVERGLAECARVLRPGGTMLAYSTLATDLLEPREAAWLADALALGTLDGAEIEAAAATAGLELVERVELEGEWRERMVENGDWSPGETLLRVSRLRRRRDELAADFSADALDAYAGGHVWGVYQLLGKLCPTVYVWRRP